MSDINVISRTQRLIIDPPTRSVQVVNGLSQGSVAGATGVPNVSGLVHRGVSDQLIPVGGNGAPIYINPTTGQVEKRGTDIEIVNAGGTTSQMRILTEGLYHVRAYARCDGNVPTAGSLMGIRRNGQAVARHTFSSSAAYAAVNADCELYLLRDDLIQMFAYCTGGTMNLAYSAQSPIDPPSPMLSIWRLSTVTLV